MRRTHEPSVPGLLSAEHRTVVRACVGSERDLLDTLDDLRERQRAGTLDEASDELLGYVYRRLVELDIDHPLRTDLRGAYRSTWHRNQVLLFRARPLLEHLEQIGATPVVLKGGAMVSSAHYDDLGVRRLMDLDVLIPQRFAAGATEWALANGWRAPHPVTEETGFTLYHAVDLEFGDDGALDLHWRLLVHGRDVERDQRMIESSHTAQLVDLPIKVLAPTYQLFHTAAHAKPEGLRHVVDAIAIVERHGNDIDWDALVDEIVHRRTLAYTDLTFAYVENAQPGTIPAAVLALLADAPRHWSDYPFHGAEMSSRTDVVKRFFAELAGRTRGAGPKESMAVAVAMVRRFGQHRDISTRALVSQFFSRGGNAIDKVYRRSTD